MTKISIYQRIKDSFEDTVESNDLKYSGSLLDIDYFGLFCQATSKDKLYKYLGVNCCMFNFLHEKDEAVLILFSIPATTSASTKNIADRVMEITETMEKCFTTVDYIHSREKKDEKFVYVTVIKQLEKKGD